MECLPDFVPIPRFDLWNNSSKTRHQVHCLVLETLLTSILGIEFAMPSSQQLFVHCLFNSSISIPSGSCLTRHMSPHLVQRTNHFTMDLEHLGRLLV